MSCGGIVVASDAVAQYPGCVQDAGWAVQAERDGGPRNGLVREVRSQFEDLLVEASRSFPADPVERAARVDGLVASAEWTALLEGRLDAASADAACRQEAHDLAFTTLLEPLRRMSVEQGEEIERLRAEWAAIEDRADRTPDPSER